MEKEIWRPVVGYIGLYEVSSLGNLRSVDRTQVNSKGVTRLLKGRMISLNSLSDGYPVAVLSNGATKNTFRIHRLVAEAFIPNPNNKPHIDHIDTNRRNARVENLRWVNWSENADNPNSKQNYSRAASKEHGSGWKTIETRNINGSRNAEVPVCQYSLSGLFVQRFRSISEAMGVTGVPRRSIIGALRGEFKQAGGFLWAKEGEQPMVYIKPTPARAKRIYQYEINGGLIREWDSVSSAEVSLMIHNISRSAREAKYPAGGYWWSYKKKDNFFNE